MMIKRKAQRHQIRMKTCTLKYMKNLHCISHVRYDFVTVYVGSMNKVVYIQSSEARKGTSFLIIWVLPKISCTFLRHLLFSYFYLWTGINLLQSNTHIQSWGWVWNGMPSETNMNSSFYCPHRPFSSFCS